MVITLTHIPEISVVMGVNRDEGSLGKTIDSILEQSFTDFEFIILNDGSDVGVTTIVEQYTDPRIIHVPLEKVGLTKALNIGVEQARGKYIARQDAGDISYPQRLEVQLEYFKRHESLGILGSGVAETTVDGDHLGNIQFFEESSAIKQHLPFQNTFCHGAMMFSRELVIAAGLYRESFIKAQDYDLWLRMAENHELHNLPAILYNRVIDKDSISIRSKATQAEYARLARESAVARSQGRVEPTMETDTAHADDEIVVNKNRQDGDYYLHCGRLLLTNRKQQAARRLFLRSLRAWPFNKYSYLFLWATFVPTTIIDGVERHWKHFQKKKGIQV